MQTFTGTVAALDPIGALLEKGLGGARKGVHVGGGNHCAMPDTWDGVGATPPGWTRPRAPLYTQTALIAYLPVTDTELSAALASPDLSPAEKTLVSTAALVRQDVADFRPYTASIPVATVIAAAVAVAQAEALP